MRITFHGAAHTVTGSQHLVEVNDKRILLDCGLYQGKRSEAKVRNKTFPFDPKTIDMLVLSHAHTDHAGNIPGLVKQGFDKAIHCTAATRDLCSSMLLDSGHIQEKDAEFLNRKAKDPTAPRIEPLYTVDDAVNSMKYFYPMPYEQANEIMPGVSLRFLDAGHMLGSAIVCLQIDDRDSQREIQLVFSGDLGRKNAPIIRDPSIVNHADVLIMESTYGDRVHAPEEEIHDKLAAIVQRTYQRGGAIIIPSFAVGRAQQLVYTFQRLVADNRIPKLPIYVDSPLATNVTETFRRHPEIFDKEILDYMLDYGDQDPFGFDELIYTRSVDESKALNTKTEPFIVISASGMAEAGRILHHLKNRVEDPKNTVLFVGWQAPETLGRRLVEGAKQVRIFGDMYTVRAEIAKINGLSGHADANELVSWVQSMNKKPQRTYLVHGEPAPAAALAQRLREEVNLTDVHYPELHEIARI